MSSATPSPLAAERHRQILVELAQVGSIRVVELAERMRVTEETIRRDLDRLQQQGQLERIHGGAISAGNNSSELPFSVRSTTNVSQKQAIARAALDLVEEGDVLALDASSTVLELARLLPNKQFTVVTNGIKTALELQQRDALRVFCTGGQAGSNSAALVGALAEESLRRFGVTKTLFSCKGVEAERGLSEASVEHAAVKQTMLSVAQKSILLADHSKLGVQSTSFFASLSDCDLLITDSGADRRALERIRNSDIEIRFAIE